MELFLMRHADAEPSTGDDFARPLTEKGRRQAEKMGGWLAALKLGPILFLASPYRCAHETARIVAAAVGKGCEVQPDERLAAYLVGAKEGAVEMKKGAVAALEAARAGFGGSALKWLINPKL